MAVIGSTLREFLEYTESKKLDLRKVPCGFFVNAIKSSLKEDQKNPDTELEQYYLAQHYLGELSNRYHLDEPLSVHVRSALELIYMVEKRQVYIFHYMLLIAIREARHMKGSVLDALAKSDNYDDMVAMPDLKTIVDFVTANLSEDYTGAINNTKSKFSKSMSDVPLYDVLTVVAEMFQHGKWAGGYGGMPWYEITKAVLRFLGGELSLSLLADVGWALSHNNGPIFNKSIIFSGYSQYLLLKLDVQRAGFIPSLIQESKTVTHGIYNHIHSSSKALLDSLQELVPIDIPPYVRWDIVKVSGVEEDNICWHLKKQEEIYGSKGNVTSYNYGMGYVPIHIRGEE